MEELPAALPDSEDAASGGFGSGANGPAGAPRPDARLAPIFIATFFPTFGYYLLVAY